MDDKIEKVETEEIPQERSLSAGNPNLLLQLAIENKLDVNSLRELMQMKREWDAEEARKEYIKAMVKFQTICPAIPKTKDGGKVKATGEVAYKFAPIEVIDEVTRPAREECGFSYTFDTPEVKENGVEAIIKISHKAGHSETHKVFMPFVNDNALLSPPQKIGSTMSYAKRYCMLNGFGLTTADDDTDAIGEELDNMIMNKLNLYDVNDKLKAIYSSFTKKQSAEAFLNDLPEDEDIIKFKELLKHEVFAKSAPLLWQEFQKKTKTSVKKLLTDMESKTKPKE